MLVTLPQGHVGDPAAALSNSLLKQAAEPADNAVSLAVFGPSCGKQQHPH